MSPGAVAIQIANRIGDTKNLGPGETGVATATCQSGELITGGGLAGINVAVTTMRVSDIELTNLVSSGQGWRDCKW